MKTKVRCNTCKFGDWSVKGPIPCKECIGFHKWQSKPATHPLPIVPLKHLKEPSEDILAQCDSCGKAQMVVRKCPYLGYEYGRGWVIKCECGGTLEV